MCVAKRKYKKRSQNTKSTCIFFFNVWWGWYLDDFCFIFCFYFANKSFVTSAVTNKELSFCQFAFVPFFPKKVTTELIFSWLSLPFTVYPRYVFDTMIKKIVMSWHNPTNCLNISLMIASFRFIVSIFKLLNFIRHFMYKLPGLLSEKAQAWRANPQRAGGLHWPTTFQTADFLFRSLPPCAVFASLRCRFSMKWSRERLRTAFGLQKQHWNLPPQNKR